MLRVAFDAAGLPALAPVTHLPGYNRFAFSVQYSMEAHFPAEARLPLDKLAGLSLANTWILAVLHRLTLTAASA